MTGCISYRHKQWLEDKFCEYGHNGHKVWTQSVDTKCEKKRNSHVIVFRREKWLVCYLHFTIWKKKEANRMLLSLEHKMDCRS